MSVEHDLFRKPVSTFRDHALAAGDSVIGRRGRRQKLQLNIVKGILLKLASAIMFAVMQALVRSLGEAIPVGQVVFFRSAFAIVPVLAIYAWRGEIGAAVRTGRPLGHLTRGLISVASMFLNRNKSSK